ncbi:aspartate/glutamate racemase family protein [Bacillus infantis]|uniref:aspartate/glutamate racemase family protein n=1 Tax=Bacillus infantis TaxID=324767 RepID=UPI0021559FEA|nr:aspartate/glutamate racemase family protein [Bacillus infantis]MCR6610669.1 aspartate/glutamate racemase family protein [Bacillus infantis]
MKTIGLIGGMSWESTSVYYSYINRLVQKELGGLHSARCLLYSFDFEEIAALQRSGDWEMATEKMIEAAKFLEKGGVDCIVICTNTMHLMAEDLQKACKIPVIHIVECAVEEIKKQGIDSVGLLGTKFTMEQPFYKKILEKNGIEVLVPEEEDRELVHEVIFGELCRGEFKGESKTAYLDIINRLEKKGAQGIILGCTEIPLLISQEDCRLPLFDTTFIHASKAVRFALSHSER